MTAPIDPDNLVVKLCADGMTAEAEGRPAEARRLFEQAYEQSATPFEACIAAHYVARHQPDARAERRWNEEALRQADAVGDDRVRGFYPSLYLNLCRSHELLGDVAEARRCYTAAMAGLDHLPAGGYGDLVRRGLAEAKKRLGASDP